MMTVKDIFALGAALISEEPGEDPDTEKFTPHYMNILLAETFDVENGIRRSLGEDELAEIPMVKKLTDEVPYHAKLTRIALPYGLAANYFRESGDNYHEVSFRGEYANAVNAADVYDSEMIKSCY